MIVAALPIEPPECGKSWAFHVINDEAEPIESILVEHVTYTWGDSGNTETLNLAFGALAPGASVEVYREQNTELRTGLTLRVCSGGRERTVYAEVGRLYAPGTSTLDHIPILERRGKLAEID